MAKAATYKSSMTPDVRLLDTRCGREMRDVGRAPRFRYDLML